jgi:hypothetical protein
MMGIEDPFILVGYAFAIGLTIACIIYGMLNREKGAK